MEAANVIKSCTPYSHTHGRRPREIIGIPGKKAPNVFPTRVKLPLTTATQNVYTAVCSRSSAPPSFNGDNQEHLELFEIFAKASNLTNKIFFAAESHFDS